MSLTPAVQLVAGTTHEAYLLLIADAERFARTHTDVQTSLDDAWKATVLRHGELGTKARGLDEQIKAWERTPTRVALSRVRVRDAYADEMGLESAELPFIAELIDMRDGQDHWRAAANAVMGGWAQNLVADERHRQELRKKVERHEHPFRLSRTAVTPDLPFHDNADTNTLGKVIVKADSAFGVGSRLHQPALRIRMCFRPGPTRHRRRPPGHPHRSDQRREDQHTRREEPERARVQQPGPG